MKKKLTFYISFDGCDDSTKIKIDLTREEYETLKRVQTKINEKSNSAYMPTMNLSWCDGTCCFGDRCEVDDE